MEREGENVSEGRVEKIGSINVHGTWHSKCMYIYYRE